MITEIVNNKLGALEDAVEAANPSRETPRDDMSIFDTVAARSTDDQSRPRGHQETSPLRDAGCHMVSRHPIPIAYPSLERKRIPA